jgi:hypothetical protein
MIYEALVPVFIFTPRKFYRNLDLEARRLIHVIVIVKSALCFAEIKCVKREKNRLFNYYFHSTALSVAHTVTEVSSKYCNLQAYGTCGLKGFDTKTE